MARGYGRGGGAARVDTSNGHRGEQSDRSGHGRGRGRGYGRRTESEPGARAAAADAEPEPGEGPEVKSAGTKALVEALRAFSSPQWWLISSASTAGDAGKAKDEPRQRRMKREAFQQLCQEKHAEMAKVYENAMMNDSEQRWLRKVCSEGTAGDKVASLTMLIQVCPVFSSKYIKSLLNMASKMGRSDAVMALDALKDAFINTLLPDRKLKGMLQVEPAAKSLSKSELTELCVVTYFEDYLKTAFAAFVQVLGEAAHNSIVFFKTKAIKTTFELLAAKPEQERALLSLLVNKFGDIAPKVSSNVAFHLKKLLGDHPGMKSIIAKEIEMFLFRPNITQKSKYFAMLFLSEMILKRGQDKELAARLVHIFVGQLEEALKPPKSRKELERLAKKKGKPQKPAKRKLRRKGLAEDDNRIIRTLINGIQRWIPYLDATVAGSPVQTETVDTLFKICHTVSSFSTRIAILSLLFKILISSGDLPDRFYRLLYEQLLHWDLFSSAHRLQAFLLLKKCVPVDASISRGVAVMRRLLQVGASAEPPVAAVGLGILRELFVARRAEMKTLIQSVDANLKSKSLEIGDDAEEENFVDDDTAAATKDTQDSSAVERYKPMAREPRHAKAQHTPLWELFALASHVHPFVSHGATRMLSAETFEDVGENPFQEFSTAALLEQFAYTSSRPRTKRGEKGTASLPYNSEKFMKKKNIKPHERFFYLYFSDSLVQKQQKKKADRRKQNEEDFDEEEGAEGADDEEEQDQFFDEHIKEMMPKGDGDEDDDGSDMDDPDMDDDSDDFDEPDLGGEGDEEEFGEGAIGPSDDDGSADEDDDGDEGSADEDSDGDSAPSDTGGKGKRKASGPDLPRDKKVKAIKKKHSGSLFASAEDFGDLLGEDFA